MRRRARSALAILIASAALAGFESDGVAARGRSDHTADIAAIAKIEDRLMNAKRGEEMRPYLDPNHTFIWDVVDHPRYGPDEVVKHIDEVLTSPQFKNFKPSLVYMEIEAGDTVAFANSIQNLVLRDPSGKIVFDSDYRVTDTYHKVNGKWLVVGEHLSFPVDLVAGKAAFGRAPLPPGKSRLPER